jgi:hypothetical protein
MDLNMINLESKSRIALALSLSAIPAVHGLAYADAQDGQRPAAEIAETSLPEIPAPSDLGAPRYSLPWQLRPVTIETFARVDGLAAVFNDANGNLDKAVATAVTAAYRIDRRWAPMVRVAFVGNDAPGAATDGRSVANPLVGATYGRAFGSGRLALFGATTLPIGTGGGDAPNIRLDKTNAASRTARPADHAMFAVSYMAAMAGAAVAHVSQGLTLQIEVTLLQLVRARGARSEGATDPFRTEAAAGLHLGYFFGEHVSLSGDVFYRRWLSHPTTVSPVTGSRIALSDANMSSTTVAIGPRFHFRVGKQGWMRPGFSLVRGFDARLFDAPLLTAQTTGVQVDVPLVF